MKLSFGIVGGILCLVLALTDANLQHGLGIIEKLCADSESPRTCVENAGTCAKELRNAVVSVWGGLGNLEAAKKNVTDCAAELGITPVPVGRSGMKVKVPKTPENLFDIIDYYDKKLGAENATAIKKCVLKRQEIFSTDGMLNREFLKTALSHAFTDDLTTRMAVLIAVDTCPDPRDFQLKAFVMQCLGKACVDSKNRYEE